MPVSNPISNFGKLSNGDSVRFNFKLKLRCVKKSGTTEKKLEKYREKYRTNQVITPDTEVTEIVVDLRTAKYKPPKKFIEIKVAKRDESKVEYELDEEDCAWLNKMNETKAFGISKEIFINELEFVIDRLEKGCKFEDKEVSPYQFQSKSAGGDEDDEEEDVCCVCHDGDTSNSNQIIYCDMCNIAVHQDCYGVPYIPEGSWICRRCKLSPSEPVDCCLCPYQSGAMKPTVCGRWAHVVCAIWLNEVHFGNAVFLEPIDGCEKSLKIRKSLRCLYCRQRVGACLQCSSRSCVRAFHVTCAQRLGLAMRVETVEDAANGEEIDVKRFVYCQNHREGPKLSRKEHEKQIRAARRCLEAVGSNKPIINSSSLPSVSREKVEEIKSEVGIENINEIVVYWYLKRKHRHGVPLIKRLNMEVVHRERKNNVVGEMSEKDQEIFKNFRNMRSSLETARLLSEQVKKREALKKLHLSIPQTIFERLFVPIDQCLMNIFGSLKKFDEMNVFAEPVKLQGYSAIIKTPMDLSTIQKKLKGHKYGSIADMKKDVVLMTDNCLKFNHDNDYYLKYGKKFRKNAESLLDAADLESQERDQIINDTSYMEKLMNHACSHLPDEIPTEEESEDFEEFSDTKLNDKKCKTGNTKLDVELSVPAPSLTPQQQTNEDRSNRRRLRGSNMFSNSDPAPLLFAPSPLEQDEQMEEDGIPKQTPSPKKINTKWKALFGTGMGTGNSFKRKCAGPVTTPKRKKENAPSASILPFLTSNGQKENGFAVLAKSALSQSSLRATRNQSRSESANISNPSMFRESATRYVVPDTASSTEDSAEEEIDKPSGTAIKNVPKSKKIRPQLVNTISAIERAKTDAKSIFAHNALVVVDGKAAKVIESQLAHLSNISSEQRQKMLSTRPSKRNGYPDNDNLLYVEFFNKKPSADQYKWVSSDKVTMLDCFNWKNTKVSGIKEAREWFQQVIK